MTKSVEIEFTEDQAAFFALSQKYTLFSGGFGSGKTSCMIRGSFVDATHSSSAIIGLFQPKYELIDSFIFPLMEQFLIEQGIRYTSNKKLHEISTSNGQIGDFIFRSFDKPELIVGYEVYRAHVDEIDVTDIEQSRVAWNKIIARCRQRPLGLPQELMLWNEEDQRWEPDNRVRAYSTPEGYKFTYQQWCLSKNPEYAYICADSRKNNFLPKGYVESLMASYPDELVDAYVRGQWVNMASGAVYSSYDPKLHGSKERIKPGEPLYIGCDFNVRNICATVWVKRKGQEWHAISELTGVYDTPELINIITERWKNEGHDITIYPDASDPTHTTNASMSDIIMLQKAGLRIRALKSKDGRGYRNPDVRDRIVAMNSGFKNGRIFINAIECPSASRCLVQQPYDKNGQPCKKSGFDHHNDATSYPIAYELGIKKPVFQIPVSWAS
jgi:hypothetical protein